MALFAICRTDPQFSLGKRAIETFFFNDKGLVYKAIANYN